MVVLFSVDRQRFEFAASFGQTSFWVVADEYDESNDPTLWY